MTIYFKRPSKTLFLGLCGFFFLAVLFLYSYFHKQPLQDTLRIGVVNFDATWGDKEANLQKMKNMIIKAGESNVEMLVFPELALTGYADQTHENGIPLNVLSKASKMHYKLAETFPSTDPSAASNQIATLCKKYNMYVVYGFAEIDATNPMTLYNAAAIIGPDGPIGSYHKVHPNGNEGDWCTMGKEPFIFDSPWGPIGISICYDTYGYPEMASYYAAKGCRLILNPTASSKTYDYRTDNATKWGWYYKTRLHGLSTLKNVYIASSNLTGEEIPYEGATIMPIEFPGGSMIVGPKKIELGVNILDNMQHAGIYTKSEGIFVANIDFSERLYEDEEITLKPELYANWYETLSKSSLPSLSFESLNMAVSNFSPIAGSIKSNLINMTTTMKAAYNADVDLLLFPQMSLSGYSSNWDLGVLESLAETVPGPSTETITAFCKQYNLYVGFGLLEKDAETDKLYNTVVLISPTGILGTYRQIHLTNSEKTYLTEGTTPTIVDTPFGKIGLSTGLDTLNSVELIRYYTGMGCQVILNPTLNVQTATNHTVLEYLVDTNGIYLLTAAPCETNNPDALRTSSSTILGPKYGSNEKSAHIERSPYYIDYYGNPKPTFFHPLLLAESINLYKGRLGSLYETPRETLTIYPIWYNALAQPNNKS